VPGFAHFTVHFLFKPILCDFCVVIYYSVFCCHIYYVTGSCGDVSLGFTKPIGMYSAEC